MGAEPAVLRVFVALAVDEESARLLERIASELRAAGGAPKASWTPPEKTHLTLQFMGALPAGSVESLTASLATRFAARPPPVLGPLHLGAFPSPARAQIVVAHVGDPGGDVAELAREAGAAAAEVGAERETRTFRPHITLARTRRTVDARRWLAAVSLGEESVRATQITLFRSDLGPTGSRYVPLARFAFERR